MRTVEQPDIEFLVTDKYGIVQTGKRAISGMDVYFRGTDLPTYKSNAVRSALYGQALQMKPYSYVYLDASGTGLRFTGSSSTVTSFTVGTYVYLPGTNGVIWSDVITHRYTGADWEELRLRPLVDPPTYIRMSYSEDSTSYITMWAASIPESKRSGWVHVTFTYDATSGALSTYLDGVIARDDKQLPWNANSATGAYGPLHVSPFLPHPVAFTFPFYLSILPTKSIILICIEIIYLYLLYIYYYLILILYLSIRIHFPIRPPNLGIR